MFFLILSLAIFLRFYCLGSESIWLDESISIENANLSFLAMLEGVINNDGSPPLYFSLLWLWVRIFGSSEFAVRLLSALLGIISVFLMYRLGKLLLSEKEALLGVFIFTIGKPMIWMSQEARMYSLFIMLVLISSILFVKFCNIGGTDIPGRKFTGSDTKLLIGLTVVNILIIYTHLYGLFFVLSEAIYILFIERRKLKQFVLSCIIVGIFYIPWAIILKSQVTSGKGDWIRHLGKLGPYYILWKLSSEHKLLAIVFLILVLVTIFFTFLPRLACSRSIDQNRKGIKFLLIWILTPIILAYVLSYLIRPFLDARYVFFVIPAYYLLISKGIFFISNKLLRVLVVFLITGMSLYFLNNYYSIEQKEQWREGVNFIESSGLRANAVVLTGGMAPFKYYYKGGLSVECFPFALSGNQGSVIADSIENRINNCSAIWFLKTAYNNPVLDAESRINKNFECKLSKGFYAIEVHYYTKRLPVEETGG